MVPAFPSRGRPSGRTRRSRRSRADATPWLVSLLLTASAPLACNAILGVTPGELSVSSGSGGGSTTAGAGAGGQGGASSTTGTGGHGGTGGTDASGGGGAGGAGPTCAGLGGVDGSTFVRARRAGGGYVEQGRGIAFTQAGGVAVAGVFSDSETVFGGAALPYPDAPGDGPGEGYDLFLAQYKPSGLFDWAVAFNGPDDQSVAGMARDATTGRLVITGNLEGSLTFGQTTLSSDKTREVDALDVFVASLDASGTPLWATRLGGQDNESAMAVATDSHGNVIVAGVTFSGMGPEGADVDFGSGVQHLDPWYSGVFLSKFDMDGLCLWSHVFPVDTGFLNYWNPGAPVALAVTAHDDIVLAGGAAGLTNTFGQGPLDNHGDFDVFVYECDADGNYLFATTYGDGERQYARAVATDACGDVYLAGTFERSAVFAPLPALVAPEEGIDPASTHIFLARLDAGGNPAEAPVPVWSKGFWDDGLHDAVTLNVDGAGNLLVGGRLVDGPSSKGIDFGDGVLRKGQGKSSYMDYRADLFLAKLTGDGALRWARRQGGVEIEEIWAVALADDGRLAATGDFDEPFDFGGGSLTPANMDVFMMQLGP